MSLRDSLRNAIRRQLLEQQQTSVPKSNYHIAAVNAVNADGTCDCMTDTGDIVTAKSFYTVVVGQRVMIMTDLKGNASAVPMNPLPTPIEVIHPPYYTGGKLRFVTDESSNHSLVGFPGYPSVRFQDQGNSTLFRLSEPTLTGWQLNFTSSNLIAFSPNGNYVVLSLTNGTSLRARGYKLGSTLQSTGVIDAPNKINGLKAQLVGDFTLPTPTGTTTTTMEDVSIDDSGNIYVLASDDTPASSITCPSGDKNISAYSGDSNPTIYSFIVVNAPDNRYTITSASVGQPWNAITQITQPTGLAGTAVAGVITLRATSSNLAPGCYRDAPVDGAGLTVNITGPAGPFSNQFAIDLTVLSYDIIVMKLFMNGNLVTAYTLNGPGGPPSYSSQLNGASNGIINGKLNHVFLQRYRWVRNVKTYVGTDIVDIAAQSVLYSTNASFTGVAANNTGGYFSVTSGNQFVVEDGRGTGQTLWSIVNLLTPYGSDPIVYFGGGRGFWLDEFVFKSVDFQVFPFSMQGNQQPPFTTLSLIPVKNISPNDPKPNAWRQISGDNGVVYMCFVR